jgi:flagellar biosynthesis/type III secretory pathway protein FliH
MNDADKIGLLERELAEYKHTPKAYSTMEQTMMEAEERSMELEKANEQLLKLRGDAIEHHYNRGKQDGLREENEACAVVADIYDNHRNRGYSEVVKQIVKAIRERMK